MDYIIIIDIVDGEPRKKIFYSGRAPKWDEDMSFLCLTVMPKLRHLHSQLGSQLTMCFLQIHLLSTHLARKNSCFMGLLFQGFGIKMHIINNKTESKPICINFPPENRGKDYGRAMGTDGGFPVQA